MSKRRKMLVVVVEYLIELIESREYLLASRQSEKYFTRRRKMSFTNYIWYLLTTAKRSLTSGLQAFVKELNVSWDSYSKQAFSQGRQRIKPEAIKALMCATQERFYREANYATWRGMRVSAIDGSRYNLPTSEELREHYGVQKSSGEQVQALGSCLYDVLNGLILDAQLTRVDGNERELAKQHFDVLKANPARRGEKELLLMDRGYPSYELIREMTQRGFLYAMLRLMSHALRSLVPLRPDRSFPRKRSHPSNSFPQNARRP